MEIFGNHSFQQRPLFANKFKFFRRADWPPTLGPQLDLRRSNHDAPNRLSGSFVFHRRDWIHSNLLSIQSAIDRTKLPSFSLHKRVSPNGIDRWTTTICGAERRLFRRGVATPSDGVNHNWSPLDGWTPFRAFPAILPSFTGFS